MGVLSVLCRLSRWMARSPAAGASLCCSGDCTGGGEGSRGAAGERQLGNASAHNHLQHNH